MSWINKAVVFILIFLAFSCYKVFPAYSSTRPDTLSNQQRFKDFLEVKLTPDVKTNNEDEGLFKIDDLEMFKGDLSTKDQKKVKKWAEPRKSKLKDMWDTQNIENLD